MTVFNMQNTSIFLLRNGSKENERKDCQEKKKSTVSKQYKKKKQRQQTA